MADFTADFEAGVNGATITTGAGEASATAWDAITGSPSYDNTHAAHGTLAAKIDASNEYMTWTLPDPTDHYGRMYVYGNVTGLNYFVNGIDTGSTGAFDIVLFGRQVFIRDQAQVHQANTTAQVPLNAWWRIEWHIINSLTTGTMQLKYFSTPDATVATETLTPSPGSCNTGANTHTLRVGGTATVTDTYWIDDIVANATAYPGPVPATADVLMPRLGIGMGRW